MLNIRINFTVNLKKLWVTFLAVVLTISHLMSPAVALESMTVPKPEKAITVSLSHLKVHTTLTEAQAAVKSPQAKYFDAEALAFLTVYTKGWKVSQWKCLQYIWTKESHFNPKATNKSSGAYGIAQFLPETWGNYKTVKTADAATQIKYGLRYIMKRYGNASDPTGACNAKAFWIQRGWY